MKPAIPSNPQVLDEDLQIIRATLATITGAVHRHSAMAGVALENALAQLDLAQAEFSESLHPHSPAAGPITPDFQPWV
ncbi:MAG: hypothetical protein RL324_1454 [Verrucomicrobiota bacterium]|jgi:hypothetical protein